ncbi:Crp/Fnr family transcriptional regulator [Microbacter margulisiae]|uniref:CRP-like cAMP-binding protein n=1 Tax=Microbacter margulisiae TaxID=1350067 RepID=A0A7W5DPM7_9PORP|nr:Crp/Fnr family transcriptional regulator [Microbacter margulisiae]MBB3186646.1 CRP-like cAMP-binding protein [Microbacter margulisiae]MBB3187448.1 CRP-like cAMP-binding protein [Microbacter margulisiae]
MLTQFLEHNLHLQECANSYLSPQYEQLIRLVRDFERKVPNVLSTYFIPCRFKKNELFLHEGSCARYVWLIASGVVCSSANGSNETTTTGFYFPGDFVGSYFSMQLKCASEHNLEMVQEGLLYRIAVCDLKRLQQQYPELMRIEQIVMACHNSYRHNHNLLLLQNDATERYRIVTERYPQLLSSVYKRKIASYIAIEPPSLSRVIKEFARKQIHSNGPIPGKIIHSILLCLGFITDT